MPPLRISFVRVLLFISILLYPAALFGQKARPSILVIESYNQEYRWNRDCRSGMESVLNGEYDLRYFEMDTKRLPKSEHQRMADLAWNEFLAAKPSLVVLADDAALKYLGEKLSGESVPVVFFGINDNPRNCFPNGIIPANMSGILERPGLKRSFEYLKDIMPRAKKALILFDDDLTAAVVKKEMFNGKDTFELFGIEIRLELINDFGLWKQTVLDAPARFDFLILGLYHTLRESDGSYVDPENAAFWTSANSRLPVFGFWDFSVGRNAAIGGYVLSGESMGREAGLLVKRILAGKAAGSVFMKEGEFVFSRSQLDRWKIPLPENIRSKSVFVE